MRRLRLLSLPLALGLSLAACNSTNPVEPAEQTPPPAGGGAYSISVAANPGSLTVGTTDPAVLVVSARKVADNQAAAGAKCAVSTSLGSFDPDKDVKLVTLTLDGQGSGQAKLYPRDAAAGSASVLAQIDTSVGQVAVPIRAFTPVPFFLTSVSPSEGGANGGEVVEITGGGFTGPMRVTFGAVVASNVKVISPTLLDVTVPRPAATVPPGGRSVVDVTVTNAVGQTTTATDKLTGAYTYSDEESSLLISGISPAQGSYTGGTTVTITGNGFEAPVEVRFGGATQQVVSVTSNQIVARTQAVTVTGCNPPSGPVTVTNLRTGASAGSGLTFSYTVDPLFVRQVSPASAGQDEQKTVTLGGSGFPASTASLRVTFGTTQAQTLTSASATQVTVKTPVFTGPFDTQACGTAGKQNIPTSVDLKVENLATGCADTLLRGFVFIPNDTTCSDSGNGGGNGGGGGSDTPPVASFTYSAFKLTVQFNDTSTGGPTNWFWDFGENAADPNNFSFEKNPTHTYARPGTYPIKLRAGNSAGTSTKTMTITVSQ